MRNYWNVIFPALFLLYAIIGLLIVRDYGISWDESISRTNGVLTFNYLINGDPTLFSHIERHHGTAFELPLVLLEAGLRLTDSRDIYVTRHIATFFFFYVSVSIFGWMVHRTFRNSWITVFGIIALILSPRIFADSFYNSKDIPLLSMGILWAATTREFLVSEKKRWAILSAVSAGLAIDIRVVGIFFPLITGIIAILRIWHRRSGSKYLQISHCLYVIILCCTVLVFWPFLWRNPLQHFLEAVQQAGAFPWDASVLYLGQYVKASELPWHYPYVWIVLTTPLSYTLLAVAGVFFLIKQHRIFLKNMTSHDVLGVLAIGWVFIPLLGVTFGNAVLYDGWRHLYFIYPGILILALYGLEYIGLQRIVSGMKSTVYQRIGLALVLIDIITVAGFMMRHHPFQQVYFNVLSGGMQHAKRNFEGDYWGLSFKQGLEYILHHDTRLDIRVFYVNGPPNPEDILSKQDKRRLKIVKDIRQTDYLLTVFRGYNYTQPDRIRPDYTILVDGAEIFGLYKVSR